MTPIILYSIMLGTILLGCIINRTNLLGLALVFVYFAISLVTLLVPTRGYLKYSYVLDSNNITYDLVTFMVFAFILFFFPFISRRKSFNAAKIDKEMHENYIIFAKIFIFFASVTVLVYLGKIIPLITSGQWASNRLVMNSDQAVIPYNNVFEKISILFTNYTQLLAIIVGFNLLRTNNRYTLGSILLIMVGLTEFCIDMYVSSRGMMAIFIMFISTLYIFFYQDINKKSRKYINLIFLLTIVTSIPYLISVTISRFSSSAVSSLVYYFGQTPYMFGLEVNTIRKPMLGEYAFGVLSGGVKFSDQLGIWVRGFYTFLGWLYADWGYVGTILIGIICGILFTLVINKKQFHISDSFLLLGYYKLLLQGVFTIGRTKIYSIIVTLIIYLIIKFIFEKVHFVVRRKKVYY